MRKRQVGLGLCSQLADCPSPQITWQTHHSLAGECFAYQEVTKRPTHMQASGPAGDEDSESAASSSPASEEEGRKPAPKQQAAEPRKGQRGRKRRTEPIVVMKEDGTREEVSPQVYRRLRRCFHPHLDCAGSTPMHDAISTHTFLGCVLEELNLCACIVCALGADLLDCLQAGDKSAVCPPHAPEAG